MNELDETVKLKKHQDIFIPIYKESDFLFKFFCGSYFSAFTFLTTFVFLSPPENRIWSSTFLYPIAFLHHPAIYMGGLIFQFVSNLFCVNMDIAVDTYGSSLLNVLRGHLTVLGCELSDLDDLNKQGLIECCEKYILILRLNQNKYFLFNYTHVDFFCRYSELLEEILSFSLVTQFGVSGVVLCTCAHQLSTVSE